MFLNSLTFRGGKVAELSRVTVLTGPAGSGKSQCLRDILRLATGRGGVPAGQPDAPAVLLEDLQYSGSVRDQSLLLGRSLGWDSPPGPTARDGGEPRSPEEPVTVRGLGADLRSAEEVVVSPETWNVLKRPALHAAALADTDLPQLMYLRMAYLESARMGELTQATAAAGALEVPGNLLQLYHWTDRRLHRPLETLFHRAFEPLRIRLDETQRVRLVMRCAERFPEDGTPRTIEEVRRRALQWSELPALESAGQARRQLVAAAMAMLALDGRVVLLDDPASHLQPGAAQLLGQWIVRHAPKLNSQVVVATNHPWLIRGIVLGGEATVVRLGAGGAQAPAASGDRVTDSWPHRDELSEQNGQPRHGRRQRIAVASPAECGELVRAAQATFEPIFEGLLSGGVIITDNSADRVLCRAVVEQNGRFDLTFVEAWSDDVAATLLRFYRQLGIPCCAILGLQVLRSRKAFARLIDALGETPGDQTWVGTRDQLARELERAASTGADQRAQEMEQLLDQINRKGLDDEAALDNPPHASELQLWRDLGYIGLAAVPLDARPWVEQLVDELSRYGLLLRGMGELTRWVASDTLPTGGQRDWFEATLRLIRGGQCPEKLTLLLAEALHYFEKQTRAPGPSLV